MNDHIRHLNEQIRKLEKELKKKPNVGYLQRELDRLYKLKEDHISSLTQ